MKKVRFYELKFVLGHTGAPLPNLSSDDVESFIQGGSGFRHSAPSGSRTSYHDPPYFDIHSSGDYVLLTLEIIRQLMGK